jgi:hypothetical protein
MYFDKFGFPYAPHLGQRFTRPSSTFLGYKVIWECRSLDPNAQRWVPVALY